MSLVVLPGVPAGSAAWERIDGSPRVVRFTGLEDPTPRPDWRLESFVAEVTPQLRPEDVIVGQDLGGVVAALAALVVPVRAVVLTGTALGPWWALTRASAAPVLWRYFYRRHGGRRFLSAGTDPPFRTEVAEKLVPRLAQVPDLPERMRALARCMRPPPDLARRLAERTTVHLLWGRGDPWYPPMVARALAASAGTPVRWLPGRHFGMWTHPEAWSLALADVVARHADDG